MAVFQVTNYCISDTYMVFILSSGFPYRNKYYRNINNNNNNNNNNSNNNNNNSNNNNNNNDNPKTRKYWVDVQRGILPSHGERDPL